MGRVRLQKSLADYVAIAISPVLIMLLVGSLAFFLLEITYSGGHPSQMRWLMFWFVFAAVLIARIQIELDANDFIRYAVLLAGATILFIFRFVDAPLLALFLLAVVWWCSHKLTWDCTLIDDSQDASGEGLLQASGIDRGSSTPGAAKPTETASTPFWKFWRLKKKKQDQPHAPGIWVVNFSLAALPLFGLGQALLPANDAARRTFAFQALFVYVCAGLGLLLTTSFLGLRRYLRQRKLKMPVRMTGMWIGGGTTLAALMLLLCLLLPRPQAVYSATAILDRLGSKERDASQYAMQEGNSGKGEGRQIGKEQPDQKTEPKPGEEQNQNNGEGKPGEGNAQTEEETQQKQPGDEGKEQANAKADQKNQQGEQQQDNQQGEDQGGEQQQQQERSGDQTGSPEPQSALEQFAQVPTWVAQLLKWILYGILALVGAWFLWKHGLALVNGLLQLLRDLLSLFGGGSKQADKKGSAGEADTAQEFLIRKSFAEYPNPFQGGGNRDSSMLVKYTYEALCAWGNEHGHIPQTDQTPMEFTTTLADRLLSVDPDGQFMSDLKQLGRMYSAMAYARRKPPAGAEVVLQRLWRSLQNFQGQLPKQFDPAEFPELQGWT